MKVFLRMGLIGVLLLTVILYPAMIYAGNIHLKTGDTKVRLTENTYQRVTFSSSVSDIDFMEINTVEGMFVSLNAAGFGNRNIEGEPALPVFHRLIEVPLSADYSIRIISQHYQEIDLSLNGVRFPVMPAQPPLSKSDDPDKIPFVYNKAVYARNSYIQDELIKINNAGLMRALNLARVDISPVQYNPVTNTIRVYDEIEFEIVFENADISGTIALKQSKASPFFRSMYQMVENYKPLGPTDELISAPATYVIISDPMFQTALQPFIQWKTKKGFKVIEGYTNNAAVGTTTTSIKAYLQGLYNSPPAGYTAPSFVLFVGDVAQIPAWAGTAGSHVTDLRYCEYTGDNLPEVYYGRFSATSVAQLQPQIDKTLEYEQYLMPDPSFLNEVVMAAGADSGHETWSNGQINYGTETYFNAAHNIVSHTYLQPEPSGSNYSDDIHNNVSDGVAYANYTAHCSSDGWADPSFTISDISGLTNAHKYGLMVGNCCLSAKFDVTSFAEEVLRAENKGAVGYIGGSNSTYWDEDYWWGCGFKTVALHPAYDAAHIGGYDGAFHDHGESTSDWYVTQGQMVVCGNYAVEESTSSLKTYYWEIYHLMGDPSLMIYYSVPEALAATYQSTLMIGMSTLTVNTEAYATVALSNGGVLLDAKVADASGLVNLSFTALSAPGDLDIVITKQNRQPMIGTIQVIPAEGPYVVYSGNTISDPLPDGNNNGAMDYAETNLLSVALNNVGVETASNVAATLSSADSYVTITDNSAAYGNIAPAGTVTITNGFAVGVANNIPDQHVVAFTLAATDGTDNWNSNFNITANAPVLALGTMTVLDNGPGCNNDGILDPGETAMLLIACANNGHSGISNVISTLAISGGSSPYLTLNSFDFTVGSLAAGANVTSYFSVTADAATPLGTPVDLLFTLTGGSAGQYSLQNTRQVVIGLIPVFAMTNGSVTTCTGFFYDSGGASGAYLDSEGLTQTFYPATAGAMVRMVFNSFTTESGYDYLRIYNGTSTSATLIGTYNGTTGPGTVTANNASGALTFNFTSDGSVTRDGWEAAISCFDPATPPVAAFSASDLGPAISSTVTFTDLTANVPTSWAWSFTPSTVTYVNGTSASSQNPQVQFNALGQYTVTLTATNAYGSDSEIKTNYINVIQAVYCTPAYTTGTSAGDYITLVQLGSINNATGASSSPYYTYYSNLSTDLTIGGAYSITLSPGTYSSGNYIAVWIDYNLNNTFETAEKLGTISISPTPATGTILFTVPPYAIPGTTRMRVREVWNNSDFDACSSYGYGETEDYNVNILGTEQTLNLTVFLESLYNGNGSMRKAQGASGDQYPDNTADQVTIELHNASDYSIIEHTAQDVNLNTAGQISITVPGARNGNYYITVRHRNSIETTTKQPVSFVSSLITYSFDGPEQAYGNNLLQMIDGHYVIYSGDVNLDGIIDTGDITPVDNDAGNFATGYLSTDVNGDGTVDTGDMTILDNNAASFIGEMTP
ncbi:MAG: PKD domain-containing protein [Bacteroidales bacterium]|nr:PKD domain-containing protein [Bacteroidales bacterium]